LESNSNQLRAAGAKDRPVTVAVGKEDVGKEVYLHALKEKYVE
jgi:hypothetical protein